MPITLLLLFIALLLPTPVRADSFAAGQRHASRVIKARADVGEQVIEMFRARGIVYPARELLIRSLKRDRTLELWASNEIGGKMALIKSFAICADSGTLGPKHQRGDLQVPEGFYVVDRYNAWSSFHLSLGLNYPNLVDRVRGRAHAVKNLGGDIFIHGDCVTIGCVPLQNGPIEILYLAALDTRLKYGKKGGRLEVHMLPGRLDEKGLAALVSEAQPDQELLATWRQLQKGWFAFEQSHRKPRISVDKHGRYVVRAIASKEN